jgi:hypothetical protein
LGVLRVLGIESERALVIAFLVQFQPFCEGLSHPRPERVVQFGIVAVRAYEHQTKYTAVVLVQVADPTGDHQLAHLITFDSQSLSFCKLC